MPWKFVVHNLRCGTIKGYLRKLAFSSRTQYISRTLIQHVFKQETGLRIFRNIVNPECNLSVTCWSIYCHLKIKRYINIGAFCKVNILSWIWPYITRLVGYRLPAFVKWRNSFGSIYGNCNILIICVIWYILKRSLYVNYSVFLIAAVFVSVAIWYIIQLIGW